MSPSATAFGDVSALALAAADEVAKAAAQAVAARQRFRIVLSGGRTPAALYRLLATEPFRGRIDWASTALLFGDERRVAPDDPSSNQRMARETLLSGLAVAPGAFLPLDGADPDGERAAERYERDLRSELGADPPDLLLLGLGPDGHTASLFPGSPALDEKSRWVRSVPPPAAVTPVVPRLTVTPPLLLRARRTLVLVTGEDKREALKRALAQSGSEHQTPARLVWRSDGAVDFFCDRAALGR
ncbi:MAG: 6-phosphogluconolactonase [Deltaproteobacteria bacterium]